MAGVGTTNISFSRLRTAYNSGNQNDAADDSGLNAGNANTSLSQFRTANFTDGSSVPDGSNTISIKDDFQGNTFGSGGGGGRGGR